MNDKSKQLIQQDKGYHTVRHSSQNITVHIQSDRYLGCNSLTCIYDIS